jgi:pimeloyl-ACP methyl ester carboxylesterase
MTRSTRLRVVGCVVLAACGLVGAPVAEAAASSSSPVRWGPCAAESLTPLPEPVRERFSCASYAVPIDYGRPAAGSVGLALMRRAAEDPAHRIGTLFVAAGGPGGSGIARLRELEGRLPAEIVRRFDLVGFDQRGVGHSNPLRCFATEEQADAVYGAVALVPVTGAEIAATLRANRELTTACAASAGPLLPHMSTLNVARDLDRLRQGVGDERLTFLGYSYASLIGATYVNLFPHRSRAIVLDGNVDPALRTGDGMENWHQRGAGAEAVLDAFLRRCEQAGPRCAFSEGESRAKFAEIRQHLRHTPVTVPGLGPVDLNLFTRGVGETLNNPEEYAQLATTLQALYLTIHPGGPARAASMTPYTGDESGIAVNCSDEPFPRTIPAYPLAAARWERESPTFGRAHAFLHLACATWPVSHPERYQGPWHRPTSTPVLLFGNRHDPATNYEFNTRMAAQLGTARLVTVDMFGHTVIGRARSDCADAIAARYLTDLVTPARGTICQPNTQPFA